MNDLSYNGIIDCASLLYLIYSKDYQPIECLYLRILIIVDDLRSLILSTQKMGNCDFKLKEHNFDSVLVVR